ncbi:isoleucine--tRNA ligase [Parasphaerochaeta coccoides]|uniref:Isoleucine--tRNA ligase n=1 Tax=Parasphaerochaeta coccoides (strain ATCC BAA-1237 / DSM 17374 / SPN1) TaxID=760011 RepID=F4GJB0_PARC1|nr:isoleucine--tRNA ligase [Parasphaerochaeta coccoides]AEC01750.1 Isoleucyl-tRNA synthetase [Parasphaerochaeta coccoides DSM 17374]
MFRAVNPKVDFPALEENILKFWEDEKIFEKSVDCRPEDNSFVFYDGPPFATGLPHFGHFVPGTIKDAIPRFKTMKGYRVERGFGWDCHGLPVEYEMQKTLDLAGYSDINAYGVGAFNEKCRSIVLRYTAEWQKAVTRMGRWVKFEGGYRTMDCDYMESVWWIFKTLYEKGLIYEGYNILPFSPGLSSPLSNFEVNLGGYRDVTDPAITVKFAIDGQKDTYFLAWTTTPWTLPSNLALALGADIDYVKVKDKASDECYILGKARLGAYYKDGEGYEILTQYKGRDLSGMRYEPLFPYFADLKEKGAFVTVLGDYVTIEEGCGIVHTAPGFGVDDYEVLKDTGIPVVCPIDLECKFTDEVTDWKGVFVKDADKGIIAWLKERGKLVKRENYLHSYPFCYRTHGPLIYRAMNCWFVNVTKIKETVLACNEQITWIPEHIKHGRFGKWLEGAHDWAISRNRFWGNPIPVWKCDGSDYLEVIGSKEELEKKSGRKLDDLHRHFIDDLTWPSPDGMGTMRRVPDILDCWFESGSMPVGELHYPFENKEYFETHFPADFINEGLDQTRGWFYTLTIIAAALFEKPAFLNCIVNGIILAADGKKMSKSEHNYTDPMEIVKQYGADALRFSLMNSNVTHADDLKFSEDSVKEVIKMLLLPLWNAYSFFITYANIDGYKPSATAYEDLENPLDRWIESSLQKLVKDSTDAYEAYDVQKAASALVSFIDGLNNWYIRRSRRRFWRSENDNDKKQAYDTLYHVLLTFIKVGAPLIPFITEDIYGNLRSNGMPESVHLCDYPCYEEEKRDFELEQRMDLTQKAISMGRALRSAVNIKIRQPLNMLYLVDRDVQEQTILREMEDIIAEELNVKSVHIQSVEEGLVTYSAKANFKILGKKLGKDMKEVSALIENLEGSVISRLLDGGKADISYSGGLLTISGDDVIVRREEKDNVRVLNDGSLTVGFDTEITEELLLEGIARDVIRSVQNLRKESGLEVSDRIELTIMGPDEVKRAVTAFKDRISAETLSGNIMVVDKLDGGAEVECGEHSVWLKVRKA